MDCIAVKGREEYENVGQEVPVSPPGLLPRRAKYWSLLACCFAVSPILLPLIEPEFEEGKTFVGFVLSKKTQANIDLFSFVEAIP